MISQADRIQLELEVVAAGYDATDVWVNGSLAGVLNGLRPYNDDEVVVAEQVIESVEQEGVFNFFTCTCGLTSCAGRPRGVRVAHQEERTLWEDLDRGQTWTLERAGLRAAIVELRHDVQMFKTFFVSRSIRYVGVGCSW